MKRIMSLLLIVATLISVSLGFTSCGNKKDLQVVGTVNGYEVHYEELRWLTMQFKDRIEETYGEGIWDNSETAEKYRAELEDAVYKSIISNYAVLTLCDELNQNSPDGTKFIDINGESETRIIDDYVNKTIDEFGSRAKFRDGLKKNYMTENLYRFITGIDVCESILFNYYCSLGFVDDSNQAAIDYIYKNFIRTVHVYIENNEGESIDDNRALANAVHRKLMDGEDISELIKKYGEDKYMSAENGYYFGKGTYSEAYESAAFALGIDETSEVIETYSGFYIIKRLELDDQYIAINFVSSFRDRYFLAVFDEYIEECKATLKFEPNEYGSSIDLVKMK